MKYEILDFGWDKCAATGNLIMGVEVGVSHMSGIEPKRFTYRFTSDPVSAPDFIMFMRMIADDINEFIEPKEDN